ncbi:hypothetical protein [Actinomadura sp. 7K507]|uniref:hypothetical protein n=1 Tax=Actinomadura sp. 7K507 TaxID=2530365 RepID=UPI001045B477|nr:hypothetical protein [Actinomadura sp. 7K507]TDC89156.1 hypothetical protein E1285_17070 [Actinomadura sp. 7K507]
MLQVLGRVAWIALTAALATALTAVPASAGTLEVDVTLAGVTVPSTEPVTGNSVGNVGSLNLNRPSAFSCQPDSNGPALWAAGTVRVEDDQDATGLASLTSVKFNNPCTFAPNLGRIVVTVLNLPWRFDAVGVTDASGVTEGRLTGVKIKLDIPSIGCNAILGGPGAGGLNGYIDGTYTSPAAGSGDTGMLALLHTRTDSNLRVTQISQRGSCPTSLIQLGDKFVLSGSVEVRGDNATHQEGPVIHAYEVP